MVIKLLTCFHYSQLFTSPAAVLSNVRSMSGWESQGVMRRWSRALAKARVTLEVGGDSGCDLLSAAQTISCRECTASNVLLASHHRTAVYSTPAHHYLYIKHVKVTVIILTIINFHICTHQVTEYRLKSYLLNIRHVAYM